MFHAFPSRNKHFIHATRLNNGNLNEKMTGLVNKLTYRHFGSNIHRQIDETPSIYIHIHKNTSERLTS